MDIQITEEMLLEGLEQFWGYDEDSMNLSPSEVVRRIYLEMEQCRIQSTKSLEGQCEPL